ncbi:MAG: hypothetical protein OSB62_01070 [Alphaproteobacteria bacterium]|nr:hypothetical protein [Alphaproteobacteria bacterium]
MSQIILLSSIAAHPQENVVGTRPKNSHTMLIGGAAHVFLKQKELRPYQKFALILDHDFSKPSVQEIHASAPLCFHATDAETLLFFWHRIEEHDAKDRVIMSLAAESEETDTFLTSLADDWLASKIDHFPSDIRCHSHASKSAPIPLEGFDIFKSVVRISTSQ